MAESVDALVSNTSGATHPGSSPGLGTVTTKSWFQRLVVFLFMHAGKQQMAKIFCHISNLFYLYTVGL